MGVVNVGKLTEDIFDDNINVKCTKKDKIDLQEICRKKGGISLSDLIRMVIYPKLENYRKTKDPNSFFLE